jgi:hypothetical protein
VALFLYAYAIGVRSSRAIERRCREDDGGHENLPSGGHRMSPLMATVSPRWWPRISPPVLS